VQAAIEDDRQKNVIKTIPGTPAYKAGAHLRRALAHCNNIITAINLLMTNLHETDKWDVIAEDADLALTFCDANLDSASEYQEQCTDK